MYVYILSSSLYRSNNTDSFDCLSPSVPIGPSLLVSPLDGIQCPRRGDKLLIGLH